MPEHRFAIAFRIVILAALGVLLALMRIAEINRTSLCAAAITALDLSLQPALRGQPDFRSFGPRIGPIP